MYSKSAIACARPALYKSHLAIEPYMVKYGTTHPHHQYEIPAVPFFHPTVIEPPQWREFNMHPYPEVLQQPLETGLKKISKKISNFLIDTILTHKTAKENWLVTKFMRRQSKINSLRTVSPVKSHLMIKHQHADPVFGTVNDLKTLENMASKNAAQKNGKFVCSACKSTFTRRYALKVHFRSHTGYKPLQCTHCDKMFKDPSNFNKHLKIHAS